MDDRAERLALDADLRQRELLEARESLAIYAGLHIPAEIERDDLPGLHALPIAARYIPAEHHQLLISKLEAVERGEIKRLAIFLPPGSAKSTYGSTIYPAWYLGRHPTQSVIAASQTQDLADRFGRRCRNLVGSTIHRDVFGAGLAPDQRAAGHWETEQGGEYHATGVQPFAGRRGDGAILDDIIRGRRDADSKAVRQSVWEWYLSDIRPRLKPAAWLVLIMTRWHEDDPAGRILPPESIGKSGWVTAKDGEQWYVLSLAAVIETQEEKDNDPLGRDIGDILWPEWFTPAMLEQERKTQGRRNWSALYQQKPRPDEGAILKRAEWRKWLKEKPPKCEYVVSVYDTAFEEGEENDYTARTTWGVFWHEEERQIDIDVLQAKLAKPLVSGRYCCILLERFKDRVEFPKLRELAVKHYREWKPDRLLIEKKASGHSLLQELRRAKVPVAAIKADRSKLARAHAASAVLEQGCVWYMDRRWAEEVMDECMIAGTEIITSRGLVPIEQIVPGDEVLTHRGRYRLVLSTSKRVADSVVTLEAKTLDPVTMTPNHPVFAVDVDRQRETCEPKWLPAGDAVARTYGEVIRDGKVVQEANSSPHTAATLPIPRRESPIDEIDLREWVMVAPGKNHGIYEDDESFTSSSAKTAWIKWRQPLDYSFGRVLGLYVAEGWSNRRRSIWAFNAKTEAHLAAEICEFMSSRLGVKAWTRTQGNCTSVICSFALLYEFFAEFGTKAHLKMLPAWIWSGPDDFLSGLLSGYVNGDGNTYGRTTNCTTVSKTLAWQIRLLALRLGIDSVVSVLRDVGQMSIQGRICNTRRTYTVRWLDDRKTNGAPIAIDGARAFSIMRRSEQVGAVDVFNMDVMEDHSYVTTGGTVHNCEAFPAGEHDDIVDTCVHAWNWLRRTFHLQLCDEDDEDDAPHPTPRRLYG